MHGLYMHIYNAIRTCAVSGLTTLILLMGEWLSLCSEPLK